MDPRSSDFIIIFSMATTGMLILAGGIILFVVYYQKRMVEEKMKRQAMEYDYQQKMLQAELDSQENERRKLSADLHDSIGGMLSTIRVGIATMARQLPDPKSMDQAKIMLDETISSVRRISRDLMPSTLDKFGLKNALAELCETFEATSKIKIAFSETGSIQPLDKTKELMLFRITQELLNNAIKHSKANEISVSLEAGNEIKLTVQDDGVGFDAEAVIADQRNGKGLGLFNLRNRTQMMGGKIEFFKLSPNGSKTVVTLPYEQRA